MANEKVGRVLRVLPGQRVVVRVTGQDVTARCPGITPRPGAEALVVNPGQGWWVVSWG
ncbi:hypothetical protein SAMN04488058_101285 [Deinococcus reticulitermitis]|uniref:Uncharacterized protein n=1 Tax=Deinococcus reticulitermitis TaxID=856736 RepID=A0A1H6SSK8_9DEIO|nr:hypothetical protein [Deinococcus reticulitermitis]SEI66582.1 hypothetical protein SAMN04488058_101285 [Deinococcus reticulitermitis]